MLGLAGCKSILLFQRAAFIHLISLVFFSRFVILIAQIFGCSGFHVPGPTSCLGRESLSMFCMNCVWKWCVCSGVIFFGLYNSELIGGDGSRYALCLSALHL